MCRFSALGIRAIPPPGALERVLTVLLPRGVCLWASDTNSATQGASDVTHSLPQLRVRRAVIHSGSIKSMPTYHPLSPYQ